MELSPNKDVKDIFKELKKLIATLTHTGEKVLDPSVLKGITRICKLSNDNVIHAYHLLMEQLEVNHAEVRFSCFQICIELFKRSHCFRELLVSNLQQVMALTAETNPSKPMPAPRSAALELKKLALTTFRDWAKHYGSGYKKLHLGISYLKNCKKVDLNAMALEEAAARSRQEELLRRKKTLQSERFKKVVEEVKDKQPDIVNALTEMENCLSLLLPRPEDFFIEEEPTGQTFASSTSGEEFKQVKSPSVCTEGDTIQKQNAIQSLSSAPDCEESDGSSDSDTDEDHSFAVKEPIFDFRKYGIINPHFSLTLKVDPGNEPLVKKTAENASIFENAQDLYKVVCNRYQPCIEKWETILEKCTELETSSVNEVSKKLNDLKARLEVILDKYKRLNIKAVPDRFGAELGEESDTSDSDFEEVQNKDGFEVFSKSTPVLPPSLSSAEPGPSSKAMCPKEDWSLVSDENNEKDPTSVLSTLSSIHNKSCGTTKTFLMEKKSPHKSIISNTQKVVSESETIDSSEKPGPSNENERKAKLLSIAPKLPFDVDLYHWEDEKVEAPTIFTVKPDGHRFWVASAEDRDEIRDPDGEACLRTRVIEFTGNFQKVEWTCRAPLANGKLCPRQDRVKCPFHGKIIGRDKEGKPSKREDQIAEEQRKEVEKANEVPDWQDPKLLAELKESTGVDLRMPDKSKRGWRKHLPGEEKKYVGLTDIKASQNTTYNRLSKKVFKKSAMKRVAADMDKLDRKRFRDKYGDQFNYVFDH